MSNVGPEHCSFLRIESADLDRLAAIAYEDRQRFFASHPDWAELYAGRFLASALCQGAGLHYVDGSTGVNDFDVYSFYAAHPARRWYAKRNKHVDFGDVKFGRSADRPDFTGRRVDLLGRGIDVRPGEQAVESIRRWLTSASTTSARLLALKAVVLLEPSAERGRVVWPDRGDTE